MEWLTLLALLGIAASNVFIGIKVRNQQTNPVVTLKVDAPIVNVPEQTVKVVHAAAVQPIDYDKLKEILQGVVLLQLQYQKDNPPLPIIIPNPDRGVAGTPWTAQNTNTYDDGHTLYSAVDVEGVPTRQFPVT